VLVKVVVIFLEVAFAELGSEGGLAKRGNGDAAGRAGGPRSTAVTLDDYLTLLDATGRSLARGKRGQIDPRLAPILARLDLQVEDWIATMVGWRMLWGGSAIGRWTTRQAEAARRGLAWIRNRCPLFKTAG